MKKSRTESAIFLWVYPDEFVFQTFKFSAIRLWILDEQMGGWAHKQLPENPEI